MTLLERTTRKVLLSPACERLAVRAKAGPDEVGALMEEAEAVRAPFTGALRLGVIPTVAPYLLPHRPQPGPRPLPGPRPPGPRGADRQPPRRPDLRPSRPAAARRPPRCARHHRTPAVRRGLSCSSPRSTTRWAAWRESPAKPCASSICSCSTRHCLRDQALDICREAGREDAPVTTTAAGLSTLVQLVAGGLGCTLLPRTAVKVETTRSNQLLTGYFADPAPTRSSRWRCAPGPRAAARPRTGRSAPRSAATAACTGVGPDA